MVAFLSPPLCIAQAQHSLGIWHFRNISGEVDLKGQYRQLESNFNEVTEDQRSMYLLSGIKLNTSSYLWDKDILMIDLGGAYSPEIRDETYISIPDRSEVRTLKKIDFKSILFNNKPVTLQGFYDFDQTIITGSCLQMSGPITNNGGGSFCSTTRYCPLR